MQGQLIVGYASDPFGWSWNLFDTARVHPRYGLVGVGVVWYSQVALIVAGHVAAVYLAHLISLCLLRDPKRALGSHISMLVLIASTRYPASGSWPSSSSSRGQLSHRQNKSAAWGVYQRASSYDSTITIPTAV